MAFAGVCEGYAAPIRFRLRQRAQGSEALSVPEDPLSGTPTLVLRDRNGALVETSGDVEVTDPDLWEVTYTPDVGDLVAAKGPYRARFLLPDGATYVPSAPGFVFLVHRQ